MCPLLSLDLVKTTQIRQNAPFSFIKYTNQVNFNNHEHWNFNIIVYFELYILFLVGIRKIYLIFKFLS